MIPSSGKAVSAFTISDTKGGITVTEDEKKGKKKIHPEDFLNLFLVETFLNRKREGR